MPAFSSARPWTRWLVAWAAVGGLVFAGFTAFELHQFARSDEDGARRVLDDVERTFAATARRVEDAATRVAMEPDAIARAASGPDAASGLFGRLQAITAGDERLSVTVYSAQSLPLAWSGRPSDVPRARIGTASAMFVAPGPLGPRLVAVRPVLAAPAPSDAGTEAVTGPQARIATVVAEWLLPTGPAATALIGEATWTAHGLTLPLRARYEGAGTDRQPGAFLLRAPDGTPLLDGRVVPGDVARARSLLRARLAGAQWLVAGIFLTLAAAPILTWRARARSALAFVAATVAAILGVLAGRAAAWVALGLLVPGPGDDLPGGLLTRSAADVFLTAGSAFLLVVIVANAVVHARRAWRRARRNVAGDPRALAGFLASGVLAGGVVSLVFAGLQTLIRDQVAATSIDLLRFSLYPATAERLLIEGALVLAAAAAIWLAVTVCLTALLPFRIAAAGRLRLVAVACWVVPPLAWIATRVPESDPSAPALVAPVLLTAAAGWAWRRIVRRYRHVSQGARLLMLFAGLTVPILAWYPGVFMESTRARRDLVAARLAPQVMSQRDDLQARVRAALEQIDRVADLADLVAAGRGGSTPVPSDSAFYVWSQTDLSRFRLTSAIELYGPDGLLASRFALKLPDYTSAQQRWEGEGCRWELFEEVSPFFSEERRLLYAGRGLCVDTPAGRRVVGAIAIYAMLDYGDLPFVGAQTPYAALVRGAPTATRDPIHGRDVQFVAYGWSRRPVYASGDSWSLDDATFARVYASRVPFWTTVPGRDRAWAVHLSNDRGGIYALGYPLLSWVEHLVNLGELVVLGGLTFVALVCGLWVTALAGGYRSLRGRDLLREVRASFYRKLFLAFVAAAAIPVLTLAVVARAYLSARLLAGIEETAARTAGVAQRVVEDYAQIQERGERRLTSVDDDILVWIARAIDLDVNVFEGPHLVATSERNLYASGALPTRTSSAIYRAIELERRATYVASERLGWFDFLVAAAPVRLGGREAILTVPLTLRQQAIEREIDDLNRRILLAVIAFILAGSALGYWMAERIADPVNRLQRATARIARGDLTARVALTSTDELRRLVEAFNRMATELQRQQSELERTHRLEAWADMARQVAHEIKNPLTPIQLSAEHLRRVHHDRGTPLSPVLEGCVDSILAQVRLLRQIAAEFSSFASSPTPRPVAADIGELLSEVVEPYRPGLAGRVAFDVEVEPGLPALAMDRTLVGRALTNVIDNALHAMPNGGTLTVTARAAAPPPGVTVTVRDTGVGMDAAAIARIFEPYFSTKATGTGLGLTIARRNVELHGGTVAVASEPGRGTVVTMTLPRWAGPAASA